MINQNHTPSQTDTAPCVVVMAKRPVPGRVKTRLTPDFSPLQAACVHAAMLECVLHRLLTHLPGRHVLAMDGGITSDNPPPQTTDPGLVFQIPPGFEVIDQGQGDLGDRLSHVWNAPDPGPARGQTAFFGVDSPDIPTQALKNLWPTLEPADAAIGPVDDGGYWCLAAKRPAPPLLSGIDWGTEAVYHQTHKAAQHAGLKLLDLTPWHDVDTPTDLLDLQHRLRHTNEPALIRLSKRLDRITQDTTR